MLIRCACDFSKVAMLLSWHFSSLFISPHLSSSSSLFTSYLTHVTFLFLSASFLSLIFSHSSLFWITSGSQIPFICCLIYFSLISQIRPKFILYSQSIVDLDFRYLHLKLVHQFNFLLFLFFFLLFLFLFLFFLFLFFFFFFFFFLLLSSSSFSSSLLFHK